MAHTNAGERDCTHIFYLIDRFFILRQAGMTGAQKLRIK
jgi:hypothetical protein